MPHSHCQHFIDMHTLPENIASHLAKLLSHTDNRSLLMIWTQPKSSEQQQQQQHPKRMR